MRPKVLILDAEAPAALAAVQSLGRRGAEVHAAAAAHCDTFRSRYVAAAVVSPCRPHEPRYLSWLRELVAREDFTLVVPSTEHSLVALRGCTGRESLRERAVIPAWPSIEVALDKIQTWRLAADLGVPVPESTVVESWASASYEGPYPVVLKTRRSQVMMEAGPVYSPVRIARDPAEREAFLEEWLDHTSIQQQEYLPGTGWGIECLYAKGQLQWHFAHERLHERPLTGGASTYRRAAAAPPEMLDAARRLLDALEWHGVAMVEFRMDENGKFALMEINPRLWGSVPLAIAAGVDFPAGLLAVASGQSPGPQPAYRVGYRMRNLRTDLEWMRSNWLADRSDPLLLTDDPVHALLEWLTPLGGNEAWDHFDRQDPFPGLIQMRDVAARASRGAMGRVGRRALHLEMRWRHARNLRRLRRTRAALKHVMFICYGNICRSPLAGALARRELPEHGVASTGLGASPGRPTPSHILRMASCFDVDLAAHRARRVEEEDVAASDLILLMDSSNYEIFRARFPDAVHKVLFLGLFSERPSLAIADPIALDERGARASAAQTSRAVRGFTRWLKGET